MRVRISEAWIADMTEKMRAYKNYLSIGGEKPKEIELVTAVNESVRWLILSLTGFGIPFKVIQLIFGSDSVLKMIKLTFKIFTTILKFPLLF